MMSDLSRIPLSLGFEDVGLKHQKNLCTSRLDVNITSEVIRGIELQVPVIAANMSTVTNANFCIKLARLGAMGILHRAAPTEWLIKETAKIAANCVKVAVSIGIGEDQYKLAHTLVNYGANIITIDIANGWCDAVIDLAKKLKREMPSVKLIVGNTSNVGMLDEVADFADAVKVGIANGSACETKSTAGCNEKQFSTVLNMKERARQLGLPLISDGGIREAADFVKAIGAGASSIMAGSIFAACPESAAEEVNDYGVYCKRYAGMASAFVQESWKGGVKPGTCAEGGVRLIPLGEPVEKLLEHYSGALRSGITYGGGKDIKSFQRHVEFVRYK